MPFTAHYESMLEHLKHQKMLLKELIDNLPEGNQKAQKRRELMGLNVEIENYIYALKKCRD